MKMGGEKSLLSCPVLIRCVYNLFRGYLYVSLIVFLQIPMKIESLAGLGVIKVECGSQFSVALTRSGSVYTW